MRGGSPATARGVGRASALDGATESALDGATESALDGATESALDGATESATNVFHQRAGRTEHERAVGGGVPRTVPVGGRSSAARARPTDRPIERRVTPGRTAVVGLAGVVAGQYLLYVDPATTIAYATTLWVSVLLLTGGLLLGYGAGAA